MNYLIKIGLFSAALILFVGVVNIGIAVLMKSPNGSFQDHLNTALLLMEIPAFACLIFGLLSLLWSIK